MTAAILAGGRSSRFGRDKSLVPWRGAPLIEHLAESLSRIFDTVMVVTDNPLDYTFLKTAAVRDLEPGLGPLGGLFTALHHLEGGELFLRGCDMPLVHEDTVRFLVERGRGKTALVPEAFGRVQPLSAVYSKRALKGIEEMIRGGDLAISGVAARVKGSIVREEEIKELDPELTTFLSFNTQKELDALRTRFAANGF